MSLMLYSTGICVPGFYFPGAPTVYESSYSVNAHCTVYFAATLARPDDIKPYSDADENATVIKELILPMPAIVRHCLEPAMHIHPLLLRSSYSAAFTELWPEERSCVEYRTSVALELTVMVSLFLKRPQFGVESPSLRSALHALRKY